MIIKYINPYYQGPPVYGLILEELNYNSVS